MRANRQQEFVIGGYVPTGKKFDAILFGYYEGSDYRYAASIRAGFTPGTRQTLFAGFSKLDAEAVLQSARPDERSMGRRDNGRGHGEVPLAQAPHRSRNPTSWNGRPTVGCAMRRSSRSVRTCAPTTSVTGGLRFPFAKWRTPKKCKPLFDAPMTFKLKVRSRKVPESAHAPGLFPCESGSSVPDEKLA